MPLAAVQIVADSLLFDHLTVDLYSLPPYLADEVRDVMRIYLNNKAKDS